ncbi:hypothetical protein [Paenibacillus sp. Z6-24]
MKKAVPAALAGLIFLIPVIILSVLVWKDYTSTFQLPAETQQADPVSVESFVAYVKQWNAIVINSVIWLGITLLIFIGVPLLIKLLTLRRQKQLQQGILIQGTIVSMAETGTQINDQPLIRFTVSFMHEGRSEQVEIRQVISYLHMPKTGDPVMISYNPVNGKALFITENDQQKNNLPPREPEVIASAVLQQIDSYGPIHRSEALLLHFEAAGQRYRVPVVQAPGFFYQVGETANLLQIGSTVRIFSYGEAIPYRKQDHTAITGQLVHVQKYPLHIDDRQLMLLELITRTEGGGVTRLNSQFVPPHMIDMLQPEVDIPVSVKVEEYNREAALLRGKQGSAIVRSVQFRGTNGERPRAVIMAERGGVEYRIEQSIEPLYGVVAGDELWVAYDEQTREAVIVKYASVE